MSVQTDYYIPELAKADAENQVLRAAMKLAAKQLEENDESAAYRTIKTALAHTID